MKFRETYIVKNFTYPISCIDMNLSENGCNLVSIGTYKPSVKIHDLINLTQKTNRHLEADPLKVISLTKNAEKLAILRVDRYVELHVKYGMHERIRFDHMCYDLKINKFNCELLGCGKADKIYRFNLEKGCFVKPYTITNKQSRSLDINKCHGLIGYCGDSYIEFIDQRNDEIIKTVDYNENFTTFSFSENGINFCCGTDNGLVKLFDLRSKDSIYEYKHDSEVLKTKMVNKSVISVDENEVITVKDDEIYDRINFNKKINTFESDGGVIFVGLDDVDMRMVYSSEFGKIPDWCNIMKVEENL